MLSPPLPCCQWHVISIKNIRFVFLNSYLQLWICSVLFSLLPLTINLWPSVPTLLSSAATLSFPLDLLNLLFTDPSLVLNKMWSSALVVIHQNTGRTKVQVESIPQNCSSSPVLGQRSMNRNTFLSPHAFSHAISINPIYLLPVHMWLK